MGSFSVYCELSKVTISAGMKCGVVFLAPERLSEAGGRTPICPPIWGTYNDYGGIEDIEESAFTRMIETVYGKNISDLFESCYEETEKELAYCWVSRDVYEKMAAYHPSGFRRVDNIDTGKFEVLTFLGMTKLEGHRKDIEPQYAGIEAKDLPNGVGRYSQVWEGHGLRVYSDGTYLECDKYHSEALKKLGIPFPADFATCENQNLFHLFKTKQERKAVCGLFGAFGRSGFSFLDSMEDLIIKLESVLEGLGAVPPERKPQKGIRGMMSLISAELEDDLVAQALADLLTVTLNSMSFSFKWSPMQQYSTPQCGEYEIHQHMLEIFAEVNKAQINEDEE